MPAHLRKSSGDSKLSVCSTNDSIQESNFRLPFASFTPGVVFESFWILDWVIIAFVPTDLAVIRDSEFTAVGQGYSLDEVVYDTGNDFVFEVFGIHEGDSVVVLEHNDDVVFPPDVKHGAIDDIG